MHCLYGTGVDTVQRFVNYAQVANLLVLFHSWFECLHRSFCRLYYKPGTSIEGSPQLIPGDGDGTVNVRSLEGCKYWQGKQKQKVYSQAFPGVNHMDILRNINVLNYIKTVLTV